MPREDITFPVGDVQLRGWVFHPPNVSGPAPTVVMSHGFAAVKEQSGSLQAASRLKSAGLHAHCPTPRDADSHDMEPGCCAS
ncbi:hypothetical protein [Streptomyces sp. NPDC002845]